MDSNKNFIGRYQIENLTVCDDLISFWKASSNKIEGQSYKSESGLSIVDKDWKDSVDVCIGVDENDQLFTGYIAELKKAVEHYRQQFPYSCNYSSWKITEGANIQYYKPGAGFKAWHCERGTAQFPVCNRHLAWMTYLNDVPDGGTEFFHQNLIVEAVKGLTLIWPADWTHTHRGVVSTTKEKYIITGWFNFF